MSELMSKPMSEPMPVSWAWTQVQVHVFTYAGVQASVMSFIWHARFQAQPGLGFPACHVSAAQHATLLGLAEIQLPSVPCSMATSGFRGAHYWLITTITASTWVSLVSSKVLRPYLYPLSASFSHVPVCLTTLSFHFNKMFTMSSFLKCSNKTDTFLLP